MDNKNIENNNISLTNVYRSEYFKKGKALSGNDVDAIAESIMEVKEKIAPFVNDLIFSFYNLVKNAMNEDEAKINFDPEKDIVGCLPFSVSFADHNRQDMIKNYIEAISNYAEYFDGGIVPCNSQDDVEYNYNVLRLVSLLRNFCVHSRDDRDNLLYDLIHIKDKNNNVDSSWLQELLFDSFAKKEKEHALKLYIKHIVILQSYLEYESPQTLAQEYCDYIFECENNSKMEKLDEIRLGVDHVNLLFQTVVKNSVMQENEWEYTANFIVNKAMQSGDDIVANLEKFAGFYFEKFQDTFKDMEDLESCIKNIYDEKADAEKIAEATEQDCVLNAKYFYKLIFHLGKFISQMDVGKLIDGLLECITKLNNGLILINSGNNEMLFSKKYEIFQSTDIMIYGLKKVKELLCRSNSSKVSSSKNCAMALSNFANDSSANNTLLKNAIEFIGFSNEENAEEFNKMTEDGQLSEEDFDNLVNKINHNIYDAERCVLIRDYFQKHIVENESFLYILQHKQAVKANKLLKNESFVQFAISNMEKDKVEKMMHALGYYANTPQNDAGILEKRILEMSFELVSKQYNDGQPDNGGSADACLEAVATALRELLGINTEYFIAHSMIERDYENFQKKVDTERDLHKYFVVGANQDPTPFKKNVNFLKNPLLLADWYMIHEGVEENFEKVTLCLKKCCGLTQTTDFQYRLDAYLDSDRKYNHGGNKKRYHEIDEVLKSYRNKVVHITVIERLEDLFDCGNMNNSYFDVYHNILQQLITKETANSFVALQFACVNNLNLPYSELALACMNLPFAYNEEMYNNLTYAQNRISK